MDELSYAVKKLIDYAFTEEIYNKIIRNYCNIKQEYVPILFVYSIFATLLLFFVSIFSYLKVTKVSRKTTVVTVEEINENSDEHGDNTIKKSINNISITTFDGDNNVPIAPTDTILMNGVLVAKIPRDIQTLQARQWALKTFRK